MLHTHLSSGSGILGQLVADVPSGLSLTPPPPQETKKKGMLRANQYLRSCEWVHKQSSVTSNVKLTVKTGPRNSCCDREPNCYNIESLANQMRSGTAPCLTDLCFASAEVKAGLPFQERGNFTFALHLRKFGKPTEASWNMTSTSRKVDIWLRPV
jgi:hypothetical protein